MYMPSLHNIHESHCPSPPRACLLPRSQAFPTLFLIGSCILQVIKTGGGEGLGMRLHVSTMQTEKPFATN